MIMQSFTEALDLIGKPVSPITTHAMSGLGRAREVSSRTCRGAIMGEGLAVRAQR